MGTKHRTKVPLLQHMCSLYEKYTAGVDVAKAQLAEVKEGKREAKKRIEEFEVGGATFVSLNVTSATLNSSCWREVDVVSDSAGT